MYLFHNFVCPTLAENSLFCVCFMESHPGKLPIKQALSEESNYSGSGRRIQVTQDFEVAHCGQGTEAREFLLQSLSPGTVKSSKAPRDSSMLGPWLEALAKVPWSQQKKNG